MKFGGLVAIERSVLRGRRGEITALIGPNGAGKTTVFNCITGFYKPTEGMITLQQRQRQLLLERMPDHEIPEAKVARTFQNIRLFSGMTLLENLLVAQHNKLMRASGFTLLGLFGFSGYRRRTASDRACQAVAGKGAAGRSGRRSGGRPALRRAAPAGDRPRDVHRVRSCFASTSPRRASTPAICRAQRSC